MDTNKMMGDYERTKDVILSCKNSGQLKVAVKMYNQLNKMHSLPDDKLDKLENLIGLMRIKLGEENLEEGMSEIGKQFRAAASTSGTPDLKKIRFSESKNDLTEKEIAKKHNLDIEDIKREISIGTKIEMEHSDDKKEAKKIAMDHISEIPNFYSDSEYGIISIGDKNQKNKKSLRLSKKEMKDLHNKGKITVDGVEISFKGGMNEDLDYNEITKSLRDQLKQKSEKRFSKDDIFNVIRKRKEEEQERRKKEIEDFQKYKDENEVEDFDSEEGEVDEGTGASSSGSFVGRAGGPINRLFSNRFNKPNKSKMISEDEVVNYCDECDSLKENCVCDDNSVEEATGASSNATYATSGWGKSKFMLTDKGPGKVPVKKTQPDMTNLGYQKVRVKEKCKTFPYCNQSPEAIEFYSENKIIKKGNLKLK